MNNPKRIGIIDIGTNSTLYLAAEKNEPHTISILDQQFHTVRLGRGLAYQSVIQDQSLLRLISILKHYQKLSDQWQVDKTLMVGTHVLRKAKNRKLIIEEIYKKTRMKIEVLTAIQEAKWSYWGATYQRNSQREYLVCDIGGGSTELVFGGHKGSIEVKSIPAGAVTLTEQWIHHDPPEKEEWDSMTQQIHKMIENHLKSLLNKGNHLMGVGGTVTTLAAMNLHLIKYLPEQIDGQLMIRDTLKNQLSKMRQLTNKERQKLIPFDPKRADIILAGTQILLSIMNMGGIRKLTVSDRGLRYGIALRELIRPNFK